MEGNAAAALQVLVENLISVCKEEISLIRGLEKDAKKLNETLDIIQKFLNDAEMRSITDEAVKSWLKKLEDLAFDADNVLDELSYHDLSKKMKTMEAVKKKVPSCFSSFNHIVPRHQMAHKIKEINMRFESISKKASKLGLEKRLADAHAAPDAGSETDSFTVDPIFIGRDNDVSRVVEKLTTSPTEQVFSFLPIEYLPDGICKLYNLQILRIFDPSLVIKLPSTLKYLTRNVFNDENIKTHLGLTHIWPRASRLTSERVEAESKRKWDNFIRVLEECSMHDLNPDFILEASGDNWRRMYVVKCEINKSETLRAESHSHQQSNSRFLRLVRLVVNVKLWVDRAKKRVLALEGLRVHKKQKIVRDLNLLADTASEVG